LTPKVEQFLAASRERVFASDDLGRLIVLDAKTGGRLSTLPVSGMNLLPVNTITDRIYLASDTGLIQCLHDIDAPEPIMHNVVVETAEPAEGEKKPAAGEGEGDASESDAESGDAEAGDADAGDADGDEKPAEEADPFGAAAGDDEAMKEEEGAAEGEGAAGDEKPEGEKPDDDPFD
jgi:hypothetical protein